MKNRLKKEKTPIRQGLAYLIPANYKSGETLNPEIDFPKSYHRISRRNGGEKELLTMPKKYLGNEGLVHFLKEIFLKAEELHQSSKRRNSIYYKVEGGEYDQHLIRCEVSKVSREGKILYLTIYTAGKDERLSGTYLIGH